jgi:hypothetical protein
VACREGSWAGWDGLASSNGRAGSLREKELAVRISRALREEFGTSQGRLK